MGAAPSSLSLSPLKRREKMGVEKLQQKMLEYLSSGDYCADPYKHFKEIAWFGYKTLEEFISDIPSSEITEQILYRHVTIPAPKLGMRFVVWNEPWKRGRLAEQIVILPNGNFATLQMDSANLHWSFITTGFTLFLYFLFPLRFVFQKLFGQNMLTGESQLITFNFEQLIPEKKHLVAYLVQNKPRVFVNDAPFPAAGQQVDEEYSDLLTSDDSSTDDDDDNNDSGAIEALPRTPLHPRPQSQTQEKVDQKVKEEIVATRIECVENEDDKETSFQGMTTIPHNMKMTLAKSEPVGTHKGIEGAHNSCYMDSLLFSMFYTTSIFDFLLEPKQTDTGFMETTRKILKEKVVIPLKENFYCDCESVMDLRIHLSVKNEDLMGAFMDAEQVLYLLCEEVLNETHFIQYSGVDEDGWGDFMHLMNINVSDPSKVISVQRNLEASFAFNGDIKMASVPNPALILGMPRSNRELIHYEAVIPNVEICVENLLEDAECYNCAGKKADWEIQPHPGYKSERAVPICADCITFSGKNISGQIVSRTTMRLCSVICIRGVHFTAFVCSSEYQENKENGKGKNVWYFFDSMAGGYPKVTLVPELEKWLDEISNDPETFYTRMNIPALVRRCLTDGHLCIYQPILYERP